MVIAVALALPTSNSVRLDAVIAYPSSYLIFISSVVPCLRLRATTSSSALWVVFLTAELTHPDLLMSSSSMSNSVLRLARQTKLPLRRKFVRTTPPSLKVMSRRGPCMRMSTRTTTTALVRTPRTPYSTHHLPVLQGWCPQPEESTRWRCPRPLTPDNPPRGEYHFALDLSHFSDCCLCSSFMMMSSTLAL